MYACTFCVASSCSFPSPSCFHSFSLFLQHPLTHTRQFHLVQTFLYSTRWFISIELVCVCVCNVGWCTLSHFTYFVYVTMSFYYVKLTEKLQPKYQSDAIIVYIHLICCCCWCLTLPHPHSTHPTPTVCVSLLELVNFLSFFSFSGLIIINQLILYYMYIFEIQHQRWNDLPSINMRIWNTRAR